MLSLSQRFYWPPKQRNPSLKSNWIVIKLLNGAFFPARKSFVLFMIIMNICGTHSPEHENGVKRVEARYNISDKLFVGEGFRIQSQTDLICTGSGSDHYENRVLPRRLNYQSLQPSICILISIGGRKWDRQIQAVCRGWVKKIQSREVVKNSPK